MLYRVYIWKTDASQEAEVYEEVEAKDARGALLAVMCKCQLSYVSYAWVLDPGCVDDVDFECVDLS